MNIVRDTYANKNAPYREREAIAGNWAALLLPIEEDNSINFLKLEEQIDRLIGYRVDGIYSNGTAGEFFNQTEAEFENISVLLAKKCHASGMKFQIGCSHVNPLMCLSRVKYAIQLNPVALQIILPDWIACNINEAVGFVTEVASAAAGTGLVIYNPMNARKILTADEMLEIRSRVPEVVGCKVAWQDQVSIQRVAESKQVSVFVPGHQLATGFTLGANGSYSNVACLNPLAAQRWYRQMKVSINDALELEYRIQFFLNKYIVPYIKEGGYSNTAVDKFLAAVGGWADITPRIRWPYRSIPASDVAVVRSNYEKLLPEFLM